MSVDLNLPKKFNRVVIVVFCSNEVVLLRETINGLLSVANPADVEKIMIYIAPFATKECIETANALAKEKAAIKIETVTQHSYKHCWQELQQYLSGIDNVSHFQLWSGDAENDPELLLKLIESAKKNPSGVSTLTRRKYGGSYYSSYNKFVKLLSWCYNLLVRILYFTSMSDVTFALSLMPIELFTRLNIKETQFTGMIEITLSMLRLGLKYKEIPAHQRERKESRSNNSIFSKFHGIKPLFRVRFTRKKNLLKKR